MNPLEYYGSEPIVALATPWGESAVAVVRLSGEGSVKLLANSFSRPEALLEAESHKMIHGILVDPLSGAAVDEVLCAVFRKGRGYTGEEAAEIYCHGSLPGILAILELLRAAGFRDAQPGEFTLRAFLNGRLDLTQAEAVAEIVSAGSRTAHSLALHRLAGGIRNRIDECKQRLTVVLGTVEIQLDYAEDEVELPQAVDRDTIADVRSSLESLAATYLTGRLYREGARIALSGRTNAGKSSLFNLFVREDRSIVSSIHGTTRDFVHEQITINGIPVTLYDTAGLRGGDSEDLVEQEGIRRSGRISGEADLILYLVDGSAGPEKGELEGIDRNRTLLLWNKSDLAPEVPAGFLALSTVSGEGFPALEDAITARLQGGVAVTEGAVIDSARQRDLLLRGAEALAEALKGIDAAVPLDAVAVDLREALDALGEITGEVTTTDVLTEMFSRFCVGK